MELAANLMAQSFKASPESAFDRLTRPGLTFSCLALPFRSLFWDGILQIRRAFSFVRWLCFVRCWMIKLWAALLGRMVDAAQQVVRDLVRATAVLWTPDGRVATGGRGILAERRADGTVLT